jgi:hypothetical protein
MKKILVQVVFALLIFAAPPAFAASITEQVQAAIAAGNYDQINTIAAGNPASQGDIAMYLLSQAQSKVGTNPTLAARLFSAAVPFVSEIPAGQSASAASTIQFMANTASGSDFQSQNPCPATDIFTAAISMSNQSNIKAANGGLNASVMAAASSFVSSDSEGQQCDSDNKKLQQLVSLAVTPTNTPPTTSTINAIIPSAE